MNKRQTKKRRAVLRSVLAPFVDTKSRKKKKEPVPVWVSHTRGKAKEIPISQLTDGHLLNAIKFLEQHAHLLKARAIETGYSVMGMVLEAETAFYTEAEVKRLSGMGDADFLEQETPYRHLYNEGLKRGLPVVPIDSWFRVG